MRLLIAALAAALLAVPAAGFARTSAAPPVTFVGDKALMTRMEFAPGTSEWTTAGIPSPTCDSSGCVLYPKSTTAGFPKRVDWMISVAGTVNAEMRIQDSTGATFKVVSGLRHGDDFFVWFGEPGPPRTSPDYAPPGVYRATTTLTDAANPARVLAISFNIVVKQSTATPTPVPTPTPNPGPLGQTGDTTLLTRAVSGQNYVEIGDRVIYPGSRNSRRIEPSQSGATFYPTFEVIYQLQAISAGGETVWSTPIIKVWQSSPPGKRVVAWDGTKGLEAKYYDRSRPFVVPGKYTLRLTLTHRADPSRLFTAQWQVETRKPRGPVWKKGILFFPVRASNIKTQGSCLSTLSTQVRGFRIQCFGDPGSRAVIVVASADISAATQVVGPLRVRGIGKYRSATFKVVCCTTEANVRGQQYKMKHVVVTVIIDGKMVADISSLEVPIRYLSPVY